MNRRYYCPTCGDYYKRSKIIGRLVNKEFNTVRIVEAIEKIVENVGKIPIEELEKLGDKYGF